MALIQFADESILEDLRKDFNARASDVVDMAISEGWRDVVDPEDAIVIGSNQVDSNHETLIFGFEKNLLTLDVSLLNLNVDITLMEDETYQNDIITLVNLIVGSDKVMTLLNDVGVSEQFGYGIGSNGKYAVAMLGLDIEEQLSKEETVRRLVLLQDIAMHLLSFNVVDE
jgi:hypothetical protein